MQRVITVIVVIWIVLSYGCAATQLKVVDWIEEPETYRRIQILTDKLVRVMDQMNMHKYQYAVIENNMPQAYAICNNYTLLVYRGALNDFNDNELMFILAHEISHIKLGHCQKRDLASKSYIRRQELEADLEGMKVVQGYFGIPATVYMNVLAKVRNYTNDRGYGEDKVFDAYPSINERIREVIQFYNVTPGTGQDSTVTVADDTKAATCTSGTANVLALVVSPTNGDASTLH